MTIERSRFLATTSFLGLGTLGLLGPGPVRGDDKPKDDKKDKPDEEVGATEDLMREHGVLNRILLLYDEGLRRLRAKEEVAPDLPRKPATRQQTPNLLGLSPGIRSLCEGWQSKGGRSRLWVGRTSYSPPSSADSAAAPSPSGSFG